MGTVLRALVFLSASLAVGQVLAAAPTVTTGGAGGVTLSTATLNGSANPNFESTTGHFRYSTINPLTCDDTFGTRTPASSGSDTFLGGGNVAIGFSQGLAGLLAGTTYYYCAIASNASGTGFGAVLSFTTSTNAPIVSTGGATDRSGTAATLNGTAIPNGAATTGWFRYDTVSPGTCNDSFGTRAPSTGGTSLAGSAPQAFAEAITGLSPGTTYFYCAIAQNSVGTRFGSVASFVTPTPPTTATVAATSVTNMAATLRGSVNPNGATTTAWFRYSTIDPGACDDTFGTRAPVTGGTNLGAGISPQFPQQSVSGLAPVTTYFFCAIASNAEGTSFGSVLSFTTFGPPTVTTNAATGVTSSGATLNGSANPHGELTTGHFRYGTTNPLTCDDMFGTRAPASSASDTSLGAGNGTAAFSRTLFGLLPGTTYYYCAIASNVQGTAFGAVLSFTTPATVPAASTGPATNRTGTGATLNGTVNPGGDATTAWFRYDTASPGTCNDAFGTRAPSAGGTSLAGSSSQAFAQAVAGLSPGTTYFFCAIAQNSVGTSVGAVLTFTTPTPPATSTVTATNLGTSSATLTGTANPNGSATTGWFRYSTVNPGACDDVFGTRTPASGGSSLGSGSVPQGFTQPASGLAPVTTYFFCAIASNAEGTSFGAVLSFTTLGPPATTTDAATAVTSSSATLNGSANPNGVSTTGHFRYSTTNPVTCNGSFGTRAPSSAGSDTALGSGTSPVGFTRALGVLLPATTYYYCAIASNAAGTTYGAVISFTTPAAAPTVSTGSATNRTGTGATLNGGANPNGAAATAWFRYDTVSPGTCNDVFGTRAPGIGGTSLGTTSQAFAEAVTGLSPGTTYFFCAIAQNSVGTSFGSVLTFTTPAPPAVTTVAATNLVASSATLNGTANPGGATTTGWFRYSTASPGTCNDAFGARAPVSGGSSLGSGSSPQDFARSVSGLAPATTYFFCAIASNTEGMTFGAVLSFTTPAAAPVVGTTSATNRTGTGATLNGGADPRGDPTFGWFRYSTVSPGTCNDTFGTRAPGIGGTSLGTTPQSFAEPITGLSPGTTYFFCAIAQNSVGTSFGSVLAFTTPTPPTATTVAATSVTGTLATLNGTANPGGATTTAWFRYSTVNPGVCDDAFGTRAPGSGGSSLGSGNSPQNFAWAVSGLAPATAYFFCAIASSSEGTSFGAILSFTTQDTIPDAFAFTDATGVPRGSPQTSNPITVTGINAPAVISVSGGSYSIGCTATFVTIAATISSTQTVCVRHTASASFNTTTNTTLDIGGVSDTFSTTTEAGFTLTAATAGSGTGTITGAGISCPGDCSETADPGTQIVLTATPGTGSVFASWSGAGCSGTGTCTATLDANKSVTATFTAVPRIQVGASNAVMIGSIVIGGPGNKTIAVVASGPSLAAFGVGNPLGNPALALVRSSDLVVIASNDDWPAAANAAQMAASGFAPSDPLEAAVLVNLQPGTYSAVVQGSDGATGVSVLGVHDVDAPTVPLANAISIAFGARTLAAPANQAITVVNTGSADLVVATGSVSISGAHAGDFSIASNGCGTLIPGSSCTIGIDFVPGALGQRSATLEIPSNDPQATVISVGLSGEGVGVPQYTVTPAATTNGTISPNTPQTVNHGATMAFTLTPATGYQVATATGCGGTLTAPNTYTTGAISGDCTVSATFTSLLAVTTMPASQVGGTLAALNGSVNAEGGATTAWFRYATTNPGTCNDWFGTRAPVSGGIVLGGLTLFGATITGLTPATTYYFCAFASNGTDTFGSVQTFTTLVPPVAATSAATGITQTSATLRGLANPNGVQTLGFFRYSTTDPVSCNDASGIRAPPAGGSDMGAGTSPLAFEHTITGLAAGVKYYFCAIALSAGGHGFGSIMSFETASANPPRLGNISTRMQVLTGDDVMIGGFVIAGATAKRVAIVATGPSLTAYGITNPLANPTLRLVRSSDQATIATNDDWQTAANQADLVAAGFAPSHSLEAAILVDLAPGAYTAIVEGAGGGTGVSVIGVYEVDHPETPLVNIATRGRVLTGIDVMIGGFIINGTGPQTVAIVATGPSLVAYGIASPLANPKITLVRSSDQAVIDANDDWEAHANASQLSTAGFAPTHPQEAAILVTLPPGAYTAIVEGVGGGTGVAVIGVYKVN